jgi:hypothetical protein
MIGSEVDELVDGRYMLENPGRGGCHVSPLGSPEPNVVRGHHNPEHHKPDHPESQESMVRRCHHDTETQRLEVLKVGHHYDAETQGLEVLKVGCHHDAKTQDLEVPKVECHHDAETQGLKVLKVGCYRDAETPGLRDPKERVYHRNSEIPGLQEPNQPEKNSGIILDVWPQ